MPRLTMGTGWLSTAPVVEGDEDSPVGRSGAPDVTSARDVPGGPRLARAILLAVLSSYVTVEFINVLTAPLPSHGFMLALECVCLAAVYGLTVAVTSPSAEHWSQRQRLVTLFAEAAVTYLPLVVLGRYWAGMAGYFAGSTLLLLSGWIPWVVFGTVVAGMAGVAAAQDSGAYVGAYLTLSTLVIGLVVFGLARLSAAIRYVHATRAELAQMAVISERMRFARDLHDLLGYSLSAITLKAEVTRRLVDSNPARARDELAEVLDISRQALADVRTVASGYRNISLAKEASSVGSLLSTAGINARVEISCGALEEKVDTVLATVLREAVTNLLRHSMTRNCVIEAEVADDTVRLLIGNDGVPRTSSGPGGGGLDNLRNRMEAIGGKLSAEARGDGWFIVLAEASLEPRTEVEPSQGAETRRPEGG